MNNIDPRIHFTTVTFTPTTTIISNEVETTTPPYLRVEIAPSNDGCHIDNIHVTYCDPEAVPPRLSEDVADYSVFRRLSAHVKGVGHTFIHKVSSYLTTLPQEEIAIIIKEYTRYIPNGVVLDGFIAGIGAYLAFLLLNENGNFMNQFPFQFGTLYTVESGMTMTRNMFNYISLVLTSLARIANGITLQLVSFIQTFINLWEPLFLDGPQIDPSHQARLAIDVISGYSANITAQMKQLQDVEQRLQSYVDNALAKVRREINNLTIEARDAVRELNTNLPTRIVDETIRNRIEQATNAQLSCIIDRELRKAFHIDGLENIKDNQSNKTINDGRDNTAQPQTNNTQDFSDSEQHNHVGRSDAGKNISNNARGGDIISTREEDKPRGQIRIQNGQFIARKACAPRNKDDQQSEDVTPIAFT